MQLRKKTGTDITLMIAVPILITLVCAFIIGVVVASLWNYSAPVFGLPLLTTGQGFALFVLVQILTRDFMKKNKPIILNASIVPAQQKETNDEPDPRNKYPA